MVTTIKLINKTQSSCDESPSIIINTTNSLNLPDYDRRKCSLEDNSKFIEVCYDDGFTQIVRKSSIVWLLSDSTKKFSNDRLKRIQTTSQETLTLPKRTKSIAKES